MKIMVVADDYGISPGASRAIVELLEMGRLSGTSVMTVFGPPPDEIKALSKYVDSRDVGLHFCLTDQRPLGPMPTFAPTGNFPTFPEVRSMARSGQLPLDEIRHELERQVGAFESAFGVFPSHIDGHHHVHHLPGVRELVLDLVNKRAPGPDFFLRSCVENWWTIFRRSVVVRQCIMASRAARGLHSKAQATGIGLNNGFSGAYDLWGKSGFSGLFSRFITRPSQGMLVMVHPAYPDEVLASRDSFVEPRRDEYAFLSGEKYPAMLERAGLTVARFMDMTQ